MKVLSLLVKLVVFAALFLFAISNRDLVFLHVLPGVGVTLPLVVVVLASLALGVILGMAVMVPRWWRNRRLALQAGAATTATASSSTGGNSTWGQWVHSLWPPDQHRHMTDPALPVSDTTH